MKKLVLILCICLLLVGCGKKTEVNTGKDNNDENVVNTQDEMALNDAINQTKVVLKAAEVYYKNEITKHGKFNNDMPVLIDFEITRDAEVADNLGYIPRTAKNRIIYDGVQVKEGYIVIGHKGEIVITNALKISNFYCAYKIGDTKTIACAKNASGVEVRLPIGK